MSPTHAILLPNLHPVVRPCVPPGSSAPRTGLQACCGLHGCFHRHLGATYDGHAVSESLDGPPTALAHSLPRAVSTTSCLKLSQKVLMRQACSSPHGQHWDHCEHQPTSWSTLLSLVATRPPPSPPESEAADVASCHSQSEPAQPGSR